MTKKNLQIKKLIKLIETFTVKSKDTSELVSIGPIWPEQKEIAESILAGASMLVLKARQIGSSTISIATLLCILLVSTNPVNIVILSHKQDLSRDLLERAATMYKNLPDFLKVMFPATITKNKIVMKNTGGCMVAKAAGDLGGIRGFTATHLLISDFAFAQDKEEMFAAARSAVNNGQLIIESTANEYNDMFHKLVKNTMSGETGWEFLFFRWTDRPEYSKEPPPDFVMTDEDKARGLTPGQAYWFREQCSQLGEGKARREYPYDLDDAYSDLPSTFITEQQLSSIKQCNTLDNKIWKTSNPAKHTVYAIGVDPAYGMGEDYSSIHVVDCRTMTPVAGWHSNITPISSMIDIIEKLSIEYGIGSPGNKAIVNIETNTEGLYTTTELAKRNIPIFKENGKHWLTNKSNRVSIYESLRKPILDGILTSMDDFTYNEIPHLRINNKGRWSIKRSDTDNNSHGDGIVSLGLALYAAARANVPKLYKQDMSVADQIKMISRLRR